MTHRDQIIKNVADHTCEQICRRAIRLLQKMDCTLSGDDSVLQNPWEEICVQVQFEQSIHWQVYMETMQACVLGDVESLPTHLLEAIWLQTDSGWDWSFDNPEAKDCPACHSDVMDYVIDNYILKKADNWSNQRIRRYLDRYT